MHRYSITIYITTYRAENFPRPTDLAESDRTHPLQYTQSGQKVRGQSHRKDGGTENMNKGQWSIGGSRRITYYRRRKMKECLTKERGRNMKHGSGPTYYLSHHRRQNNRKPQQSIAAAFRCGTGNTNQASRTETNLQTVSYIWLSVPSTFRIHRCMDWSSN